MSSLLSSAGTVQVKDIKSFERWLGAAPLVDAEMAVPAVMQLLEAMESDPPAERYVLPILERLQEPVSVVCEAVQRRFAGRPVPFGPAEQSSLESMRELLLAYGRAYKRHLQTLAQTRGGGTRSDAGSDRDLPLTAYRAMRCATLLAGAHYRARHEVPQDIWQDLCGVYRVVLAEGKEEDRVASGRPKSCTELFGSAILIHLTLPYGRSLRALDLIEQTAYLLAPRVALQAVEKAASGIVVDLEEGNPPAFRQLTGSRRSPGMRLIDLRAVKRQLVRTIDALAEGKSIGRTELPIAATPAEAATLFPELQKAWFESARARDFRRRVVTDRVSIVTGFAAIHDAVGGKVPKSPARQRTDMSESELARMSIFGSMESTTGRHPAVPASSPTAEEHGERWELLDESPVGFRVRRRAPGGRLQQYQLVGLKPASGKQFMLAEVRWLTVATDGSVMMGLRALAGTSMPASLTKGSADFSWSADAPLAGFMLEPVGAGAPMLVVPRNAFETGGLVNIIANAKMMQTQVSAVEQQGHDFDVLAFAERT